LSSILGTAGGAAPAYRSPNALDPAAAGGSGKAKSKGFSNVFAPSSGACQVDPSSTGGGPSSAEPSFTVNVAGGGSGDNPFFGNSHLSK